MPGIQIEPKPVLPAPTGLVAVDGRTFPLLGAAIRARAAGGLAETVFTQRYANPYREPLEVLYTLPLPADGAVTGYTIRLGEKIITGHIEKREAAAKMYEEALAAGRTAGLLAEERADTFTQKLGNLPPGAEVRVEIEILHPLAFLPAAGDEAAAATPLWQYRFPTVIGVRYEGEPGRVPDRDALDVPRADESGTPARIELELIVGDGEPGRTAPRSASHRLALEAAGGGARITLETPARLDRDLVVEWLAVGELLADDALGVHLLEGRGLAGDRGRYGLLTITPPARAAGTFARDLTILLDASGSMSGAPIAAAKAVIDRLLGSLEPRDRFELIAFASEVMPLVRGPVAATPKAIADARQKLAALEAGGATEMADAITHALVPLHADAQRQVVLLTDGYIGFENEVVSRVLGGLPNGARLHAVAIGQAPNRTLTRGAARAGRGIELFVAGEDQAEATAARLRKATVAPVLTDLAVSGAAARAIAPARPRDVLAGQPLVLAVELAPEGGPLEVTGRRAGENAPWVERIAVPGAAGSGVTTQIPIGALFGREAIADEEMRLAATAGDRGGAASAIEDRIEALGLRHRIASRRTSLVAVAEDPSVDPRDPRRRERLPVELPAGVSAEGVGLGQGVTRFAGMPALHLMKLSSVTVGSAEQLAGFAAPMEEPLRARCTRREGDLLVLEFEVPGPGSILPGDKDKLEVVFDDGSKIEARVDSELSTRPGPHAPGLTVRLALHTGNGEDWPREVIVRIEWFRGHLTISVDED